MRRLFVVIVLNITIPSLVLLAGLGLSCESSYAPKIEPVEFEETDTIPPVVKITSPADGSIVKGDVNINVYAEDNYDERVEGEIYVNGEEFAKIYGPYDDATWRTIFYLDGQHSIYAKAWDDADNTAVSATITVTTANSEDIGVNVLVNGNFEGGRSGWGVSPSHDAAYSGSYGLKLGGHSSAEQGIQFHFEKGQEYKTTLYAKGSGGSIKLEYKYYRYDWYESSKISFTIPASDTWISVEIEFAPPKDAGYFYKFGIHNGSDEHLYIDEVKLYRTK